ncbi:unnamed protein product, partial [Ectocarpus sp. 12 AP-2014]
KVFARTTSAWRRWESCSRKRFTTTSPGSAPTWRTPSCPFPLLARPRRTRGPCPSRRLPRSVPDADEPTPPTWRRRRQRRRARRLGPRRRLARSARSSGLGWARPRGL